MSSKTDSRDRGKGVPLKKPKVEGGYRRIYCDLRREKKTAVSGPARVTLRGLTEDLKGYICDVGTVSQADQFTATNKALASYAGQKGTNPQDIRIAIDCQKGMSIPIPTTSTDIDKEVANLLIVKDIDAYVKRSQ